MFCIINDNEQTENKVYQKKILPAKSEELIIKINWHLPWKWFKRRMHGGGNLSIGGKQEKDFWEVNIISELATSGVNRACSEGCTGLHR